MLLSAIMFAHPSIQDLSSEAKLISHDICPLASHRLSSMIYTLGARRQDWVLGTMGFVLHRDTKLFKVH